jgi:hypothetical protein
LRKEPLAGTNLEAQAIGCSQGELRLDYAVLVGATLPARRRVTDSRKNLEVDASSGPSSALVLVESDDLPSESAASPRGRRAVDNHRSHGIGGANSQSNGDRHRRDKRGKNEQELLPA